MFDKEDLIEFRNTIFNLHELAYNKFLEDSSDNHFNISVDTIEAIQDIDRRL